MRIWGSLFLGCFSILVLFGLPVSSAQESASQESPEALVASITAYLQSIKTMQTRFVQSNSRGSYTQGDLFFARPNKLRVEYDPPNPILLITRGEAILHYDRRLDQRSYLSLSSTPLGLILGEKVALDTQSVVEKATKNKGRIEVSLRDKKNPDQGSITLIFSSQPLTLRRWKIVDAQNITTDVGLLNPIFNESIAKEKFDSTPFLDL